MRASLKNIQTCCVFIFADIAIISNIKIEKVRKIFKDNIFRRYFFLKPPSDNFVNGMFKFVCFCDWVSLFVCGKNYKLEQNSPQNCSYFGILIKHCTY